MTVEFRLFLNNEAADENQVNMFGSIRVDQAIGMATEAELDMDIAPDENGHWSGMDEEFVQPFQRIRIEVKVGENDFQPLVDGPIVGQKFEVSATPGESQMKLIVHDDSVLMNRQETVRLFEDQTASDIVTLLFQEEGFDTEVDPVDDAGATLERTTVQRGTAMQLVRELARRHGMFAYIKPGEVPGVSIGFFGRPDLSTQDFPELVLLGAERNFNALNVEFDALRPIEASGHTVTAADQSSALSSSFLPTQEPLGDMGTHDLVEPGTVLLARHREEVNDIEAATQAAVDFSSWAFSARIEVDAEIYPAVLSPFKVVTVAGAGGHLSGSYMISRVTHLLSDEGYRQEVGLRRNARSNGTGSNGGLPGGIF